MQIRPAQDADAAAIAAVYAPYVEHSLVSFEEQPPDAADMLARMQARPRLPWLVAVEDADVVGYAYASVHRARAGYRWSADVSVYLAERAQGEGVGRALYGQLLEVIRGLGYVNAYAGIALPNAPSVALHEAVGFRRVGIYRAVGFKHGTWVDVGWWHLALRQPPAEPRDPDEWVSPAG
jgi:phosphinothricin acetyltransferase